MPATPLQECEVEEALEVSRALVVFGVPVFMAEPALDANGTWLSRGGTGGCGYWLPPAWQKTQPDPQAVDRWRPGHALAAVMGHRFDAVDIDPRNGGELSRQNLQNRGIWPRCLGLAATPSGGTHEFISPLRVGSKDGLLPGIDIKGGKPDGKSHGFVFIAPTVKLSKVTGQQAAYRWVSAPDLRTDDADTSGSGIAELIRRSRTTTQAVVRGPGAEGSITAGQRRAAVLSEAGRQRALGTSRIRAAAAVDQLWCRCEQPEGDPFSRSDAEQVIQDVYERYPSGTAGGSTAAAGGANDPGRFFDRDRGLRVASLAQAVEECAGPFALAPGDTLWVYRGGVYVADGEQAVRAAVVSLLGERHRGSHLTNVTQVLKAIHITVRLPWGYTEPDGTYLNLPNGLLDWERRVLNPHSPLVPSVHRIPVPWTPTGTCPATIHFLHRLFGDDPGIVGFVEEIVGAVLYGGSPFHQRAIMLLGGGKNGKGTFLKWMRALVGNPNVSEIKPQALDGDKFAAAQLYGKLANLAGDVGPSAFKEAERFKEVTAGDTITAERKYGQPFSFVPVATVIGSFNEMPVTVDRSEGFFRRWLVLPFPYHFVDADAYTVGEGERRRDSNALDAVLSPRELTGFLIRAVEGLRRLHTRGDFEPPAAVKAATDSFREHGDPVVAFLREHFTASLQTFTSRAAIRGAYEGYCEGAKAAPLGAARFYEHLPGAATAALGSPVRDAKRQGTRGFVGLAGL